MISESKEQFLVAMYRMKKSASCMASTSNLQFSELAVMLKASGGCSVCEQGYSVSEIQSTLHISKPAVSQVLNNLEKKGYIARSIATGDRRKIMVTLTADGEAELDNAMRCQDERMGRVFEQFGEENIRVFIRLVNRLMDILEDLNTSEENER